MVKLQDEETDMLYATNIECELFDARTCRCRDYRNRKTKVPECVSLSLDRLHEFEWLPRTCSYRLRAQSQPLPDWHPLISGNAQTVHQACMSVKNKTVRLDDVDNPEHYLVDWY